MTNLHLPATAVAEFDKSGAWYGKVHRIRSGRDAAHRGRNRRSYAVACGLRGGIQRGFPVRLAPIEALCRSCWTATQLDKAGVVIR